MDIFIVSVTLISAVLYIAAQIIIFRFLPQEKAIKGLIYSFISVLPIPFFLFFINYKRFSLEGIGILEYIFLCMVSLTVISILAMIYIQLIFGVSETSIRINLLLLIGKYRKGLSKKLLLSRYNKHIIVEKRLIRLLSSREIKLEHNYYTLGKKISVFMLSVGIFRLMWKLYGRRGSF